MQTLSTVRMPLAKEGIWLCMDSVILLNLIIFALISTKDPRATEL